MFRPLAVNQLYFVYKFTHIRIDLGMVWNLKKELSRKSIFFVSAHAQSLEISPGPVRVTQNHRITHEKWLDNSF